MTLRGSHHYTVDPKRRVTLPSFSKLEREGWFILARGQEKCLSIWPEAAWKEKEREPKDDTAIRRLMQTVSEVKLDSQGRILLPKNLMTWAGIEHHVVFIGMLDHIELWAADVLTKHQLGKP